MVAFGESEKAWRFLEVGAGGGKELLPLSPVLPEVVATTAALSGEPVVLLRRQAPYLLLGPRDRRLPGFRAGLRAVAGRAPVYLRIGGGSAVYLDGGSLSFAVARPCRDLSTTERNFRELTVGVLRGLERLGLAPRLGRAPGSYCEGPSDIVVGEPPRKVAGVAQAIRRGFALVSGMVLVDQDPHVATAFVQSFYDAAGAGLRLRPEAVTSLARELGREVTLDEAARALRAGFAEAWRLREDRIRPEEVERARELLRLRRLA